MPDNDRRFLILEDHSVQNPNNEITSLPTPSDSTKNALNTGNAEKKKRKKKKARRRVIQVQAHHDVVENSRGGSHTAAMVDVTVTPKLEKQDTSSIVRRTDSKVDGRAVTSFPAKRRSIDGHAGRDTIDKPMEADTKKFVEVSDLIPKIEADHTGISTKEYENNDINYEDFDNKDGVVVEIEQTKLESINNDNYTSAILTSTESRDMEQRDSFRANASNNNETPLSLPFKSEADQDVRAKEARRLDGQKEGKAQRNTGRYGVLSSDSTDDDSQPDSSDTIEVIDLGVPDERRDTVQNTGVGPGSKDDPSLDIAADEKWEIAKKRRGKKAVKGVRNNSQRDKTVQAVDPLYTLHAGLRFPKAAISKISSSSTTSPKINEMPSQRTRYGQSSAQSQVDGNDLQAQTMFHLPQPAPPSTPKDQRRTSSTPSASNTNSQTSEGSPQRTKELMAKIEEAFKTMPPNLSPKSKANQSTSPKPSQPSYSSPTSANVSRSHSSERPLKEDSTPSQSRATHSNSSRPIAELTQTKIESWADDVES